MKINMKKNNKIINLIKNRKFKVEIKKLPNFKFE